jgi:cardiolipin synthase
MNFKVEHILSIITLVFIIVLVESLLRKEQGPTITILWLFLIILIPYVAIPIYLIFGTRKIQNISKKKSKLYAKKTPPFIKNPQSISELIQKLLESTGAPPSTRTNNVDLIDNGEKAFETLTTRIRNAQTSISISTFIFTCDDVGKGIIKELLKKIQKDKIQIRILVDSVGSFYFHKLIAKKIKKSGIELRFFLPVLESIIRGRANLRNHRKLILIDDKYAFLGGMNISTNYLGPTQDPKRWVDLNLEVSGNCVEDLRTIFEADWSFSSKK